MEAKYINITLQLCKPVAHFLSLVAVSHLPHLLHFPCVFLDVEFCLFELSSWMAVLEGATISLMFLCVLLYATLKHMLHMITHVHMSKV